jgi:anti-anti-sigma regulatory factor
MPGAAIVRWQAGDTVVLAVHGTFDGAAAWALRLAMEELPARRFVVDLTYVVEAFDFAASLVAAFARQRWRDKRIAFRPANPEHARLLAGYGLAVLGVDGDLGPSSPPGFPSPVSGPPAAA